MLEMRHDAAHKPRARRVFAFALVALVGLLASRHLAFGAAPRPEKCLTETDLDQLERFLLRRPVEARSDRERALAARAAQAE